MLKKSGVESKQPTAKEAFVIQHAKTKLNEQDKSGDKKNFALVALGGTAGLASSGRFEDALMGQAVAMAVYLGVRMKQRLDTYSDLKKAALGLGIRPEVWKQEMTKQKSSSR